MKLGYLFLILISLLFVGACSHTSHKKEGYRQVATHTVEPTRAFVDGQTLYIEYDWEGEHFYFTADLQNTRQEGRVKLSTLTPKRAGKSDSFSSRSPVAVVGKEWGEVIKQTLLPLLPENALEGRLVFIHYYETLLYRKADGTPDLVLLKDAPAEVKIVGKVDSASFAQMAYMRLKEMTSSTGTSYTKFLLRLDRVPLSPYLYVDTAANDGVQLELPEYYEVKKEMTSLGYSASFIYSFFVKSMLWGTVKAPFTSSHRLFAWTTSSLYTLFPPRLKDLDEVPALSSAEKGLDVADFNRWLDKHIGKENYKAKITLLIDGEEFFPHFTLAMQRAQESIFMNVYIFMTDPYGLSLADTMRKRAEEGIDVRVVVDELNTVLNSGKDPELTPTENFVMPRYITSYIRKKSPAQARTHLNPWGTFDHSKVYIVDRKLAYTGGMNIGEEYRYTWHDMMVALEGPVVGKLVKNFYENWSYCGWGGDFAAAYRKLFSKKMREVNREEPGMVDVRLMYTRPNDSEIFEAQREAIRRSKKRAYIQNAYFSDDRIVKELIAARGRGVDVRVILPSVNDVGIMDAVNRYMANKLFKNGVRVYFYNGMSHVKAAVFDGFAVVGSANFDKMSLYVNREMSLGIHDPAFVAELTERLFEKDFNNSQEMTAPLDLSWTHAIVNGLTNQL